MQKYRRNTILRNHASSVKKLLLHDMNTYFHTPSIFVRLGKQEHKHFSSKLKTTCRTKKTRKIALVGLKKNCFLQNKYSTAVLVH
jgi:hypothetical protein